MIWLKKLKKWLIIIKFLLNFKVWLIILINGNGQSDSNHSGQNFSNQNCGNSNSGQNGSQNQNTQNYSQNSNNSVGVNGNFNNGTNNNQGSIPNIDMATFMKMQSIMSKMQNSNDNDMSRLLSSLKPYLRDDKKGKVDEYMKLVKMGQLTKILEDLRWW